MKSQAVLDEFLERSKLVVRLARSLEPVDDRPLKERNAAISELQKATRHLELAIKIAMSWNPEIAAELEPKKPARKAPGKASADSFTGDTSTIPLPKLITFLGMQGKSGALTILTDSETFTIVFDEGQLVHAASDNTPEGHRLGELLVSMNRIEEATLKEFLEEYSSAKYRLGEALLRESLVNEQDLRDVLTAQVQHLFHRVMEQGSAKFAFAEGAEAPNPTLIRINVDHFLLESARQLDEASPV